MKALMFSFAMCGAIAMLALSACSTAPESTSDKAQLHNDSMAALNDFKAQDPTLDQLLNSSYGYAILPSIGKGAAGIGGAYGRGEVYEQGNRVGYTDMTQGTVGAELGGQTYSELILFENQDALNRFKGSNWSFAADASAVAIKSGVAGAAKFQGGTIVFVNPKGGLMGEAAIGGQKFSFQPM